MKNFEFQSIGANAILPITPIAFLGTFDKMNKPNIMAVAWFGIVNSHPPMMSVSVRNERKSYENLLLQKAFTLSIPDETLVAELDFSGIISGSTHDKFEALKLNPSLSEHVNAPYLQECPFVAEFSLISFQNLGSHTCFFGEVMDVKVHSSYIDNENKTLKTNIESILYCPLTREYKNQGQFTGRAFSLGRTIKSI